MLVVGVCTTTVGTSKGMVMKAIDSDGKSTGWSLARIAAVIVASFCLMSASAQEGSDVSSMAGHKANEEGTKLYKAKDYEAAVPYLQLAAEWGFKDAQVRLGQIYFRGLGSVEKNRCEGSRGSELLRRSHLVQVTRESLSVHWRRSLKKIGQQLIEQ